MSQGFQNQLEFETINGNYTVLGAEVLLQKQIRDLLLGYLTALRIMITSLQPTSQKSFQIILKSVTILI